MGQREENGGNKGVVGQINLSGSVIHESFKKRALLSSQHNYKSSQRSDDLVFLDIGIHFANLHGKTKKMEQMRTQVGYSFK